MNQTSEPFYKKALECLQQLSNDPIATVDELINLKRQIDIAITLIENGELIPMSEAERLNHANRFGKCSFIVGDYIIRRIK